MGPQAESSTQEMQRFYAAVEPRWKEIATALAADRPPEWEGYRFEAGIIPSTVPERFQVQVSFGDRVSNRQRGGVPKEIVDKIAELQMTYADFWQPMAWNRVVIEQIWDWEKKSWDSRLSGITETCFFIEFSFSTSAPGAAARFRASRSAFSAQRRKRRCRPPREQLAFARPTS